MGFKSISLAGPLFALALIVWATAAVSPPTNHAANARGVEASTALTAYTVTNSSDSGPGSFRQALLDANTSSGTDTINFNIGSGRQTITVESDLPIISDPVIIDATTQPGYSGVPLIELYGKGVQNHAALYISAGNSTVRGLVINRSGNAAIALVTNGGNRIEGNYIGTDATGMIRMGNSGGIIISDSLDNVIGGTSPAARNVISANSSEGISINSSTGTVIQGNYIGTNAAGTVPLGSTATLGNGTFGIRGGSKGTIGGTAPGAGNLVSGNAWDGVAIGNENVVQGNFIGTDVSGMTPIPNGQSGVSIGANCLIGGSAPGAGNLISGNKGAGIKMSETTAVGNVVQGNLIGVAIDGTTPLPNSTEIVNSNCGVYINIGVGNVIGGTAPGEGNTIAYNGRCGLVVISLTNASVPTGVKNSIRGNSIFGNSGRGIELTPTGVTLNDSCDTDTGPNKRQNFPVLTAASSSAGSTNIQGTLNSAPGTTFGLDFFSNSSCDASGHGEGQTFIGTTSVTTDASCNANVDVQLPVGNLTGQFITATATDPDGNTSEFSACIQATFATPTPTPTPTPFPTPILMLDTSGPAPDQAAALDSLLFLREPFPVVNPVNFLNLGPDRNTRVVVFVRDLQLGPGETPASVLINLSDSNNQAYDLPAEDVRLVPGFDFTQVIFRLPDNLPAGVCTIRVKAHGQTSNAGTFRIRT